MKKSEIIRLSSTIGIALFAFVVSFFFPSSESLMKGFSEYVKMIIDLSPMGLNLFLGLSVLVISLLFILAGLLSMIQQKKWMHSVYIGSFLFLSFVMFLYIPLLENVREYLNNGKDTIVLVSFVLLILSWFIGMYELISRMEIEELFRFSEKKIERIKKEESKEN